MNTFTKETYQERVVGGAGKPHPAVNQMGSSAAP